MFCLSRACLGKPCLGEMSILMQKWLKKTVSQESLDALLQGGNESRTFYTQMLLTGVVGEKRLLLRLLMVKMISF